MHRRRVNLEGVTNVPAGNESNPDPGTASAGMDTNRYSAPTLDST